MVTQWLGIRPNATEFDACDSVQRASHLPGGKKFTFRELYGAESLKVHRHAATLSSTSRPTPLPPHRTANRSLA